MQKLDFERLRKAFWKEDDKAEFRTNWEELSALSK